MKNPYYSCKSYLQENSFCFWYPLLFSPYPRLWFSLIGLGNLHKIRRCLIHHSWLAKPNMKFGSFLFLRVLGCNLAPGSFRFPIWRRLPYWKTRRPWGRAWWGSSFLRSPPLPPSNKQQSLKKLKSAQPITRSEINQTVQFTCFVFFTQFCRSCCAQLGK